jgi:(E)-4-hydroxy-3-methyl-but-2-enyl pyrophosphate reductase
LTRQIIVAENAGYCFGVKRAVEMTVEYNKKKKFKVYTLGPLIHNDDVVKSLEEQGIFRINSNDIAELKPEDTVIIRSHGTTPAIIDRIRQTGASIVDATCPYVTSISSSIKSPAISKWKLVFPPSSMRKRNISFALQGLQLKVRSTNFTCLTPECTK